MCDLFDLLIIGVIILNEWVKRQYNNVIESSMTLNKKKDNSNLMETTIPQLTTLTKSQQLIKDLESDSVMKVRIGDVNTFTSKRMNGDIEHLESISIKLESDHTVRRYNTMIGLYQNDLELMTNYAKSINADFNLFSIGAHYFDKTNRLDISFLRHLFFSEK